MLKHIRDIRSPIAVAQQKQAARQTAKATETSSTSLPSASSSHPPKAASISHGNPRLAALSRQPSRTGRTTPIPTGTLPPSGWPAPEAMSPQLDMKHEDDATGRLRATGGTGESLPDGSVVGKDVVAPPKDVSYAVAIYPYMAEQEDEFDVVV